MGHKKLIRFEAIKAFPNVLQYPQGMQGKWNAFFGNGNGITLELACGKGEYTVALAQKYPNRNFIGIDLKGNRIWAGAKKCLEEGIKNAAFLRTQIEKITDYFAAGEVQEIWITFPDPQLRLSRAKKRLTHPRFLRLYRQILAPGGFVHLKTDSPNLYHFTKLVCAIYELPLTEDDEDVYARQEVSEELKIKTYYESLDIAGSNRVHYLKFSLPQNLPPEKDEQLKQLLHETQIKTGGYG
ncbi:tRNA (guanosine(46)-N7)-methyltransferase TrmB [Agriterribacter sp.]|uniref:tRNA (guanosine(46)-N7)-methyltransferase TrmB n=1 Tax=Agriterribacter sp. TaxID=2821509 RepID=UPI002BACFA23|nr:tRNA (guanosine(46)-N7)-methyltransferase TrmB [Agriterribacter sp.]HRO44520.1 tRNA (guanosine(46)-N7)-methyltransferase TrmB [Agriterribacter sp.]HRQ16454.1 tRNA (guanosine(46)-N7)-methyltransferase TrmB [Agriterribacter sp.]